MGVYRARSFHEGTAGRAESPGSRTEAGQKLRLSGVDFDAVSEAHAVTLVMAALDEGRGGHIVTPNVDILRHLSREPGLRHVLNDALVVADGMPLIWASRIRGTGLPERVSGASLVWSLSEAAGREGRSVFLLGGSPGAAEAAQHALLERFPSLRIVGRLCPDWGFEHRPGDMATIKDALGRTRPDLVYVALGFPKQELLIRQLRECSPNSWFLGCGAALSFAGDLLRRAPAWTQRLGLEWVHRLVQEPRRLAARYLVHGVPFALRLLGSAAVQRLQGTLMRMGPRRDDRGGRRRPGEAADGGRFAYVCGAFRVSLHEYRGSIGPRAHVTGFLNGMRAAGVSPRVYLVGDDWLGRNLADDSVDTSSPSMSRAAVNDVARLLLRPVVRRRTQSALGDVGVIYERQSTFQDIGRHYQKRGIPWVIESNGPFWYEASVERNDLALKGIAKRLELSAYRDADLVVVVSEALQEIIVRETGRSAKDVLVLPNATDAVRFDPAAVEPRRLADGVVIGFCGYLTEWAGVDLLLQAVAAVRGEEMNVSAVVIGDGPQRARLERLATDLGIADDTHFTGRMAWSEVPPLLAGLDIGYSGQRAMAIGSMYHSPQKLYEYQAMGLPVVASDHADARRVVGTDFGWLFQSDDWKSLIAALRAAVTAPDRAAVGMAARARLLTSDTWEIRVRALLTELRDRGLMRQAEE